MTLIRGGPAGPSTEDALGHKNLVQDDRAVLWDSLGGREGILRGFDHSLVAGQLAHEFTAGAAMAEERDASGNPGTGRGYHLFSDVTFQVTHAAPSAQSRNDAVVFVFADIEGGPLGSAVAQSGPQVVAVTGTSGVTTPQTDTEITDALGKGGWFRFADVIIDPADTEVNPANVTLNAAVQSSVLPYARITKSGQQNVANATAVQLTFAVVDVAVPSTFADTANDQLVVPEDGDYFLEAQVRFAADASGGRWLRVDVNGSPRLGNSGLGSSSAVGNFASVSGTLYGLTAGDTIVAQVLQNSGATLATSTDSTATYLGARKLAGSA